jgi:two-component sensor histidine kinase
MVGYDEKSRDSAQTTGSIERALSKSDARIQCVVESAPNAMDGSRRIEMNAQTERLFGSSREDSWPAGGNSGACADFRPPPINAVIPCGLIGNELSNALKHGFPP